MAVSSWRDNFLPCVMLLMAVGCADPESVRQQTAPKIESNAASAPIGAAKERIIGVIAPNASTDKHGWFFFKLRGPESQVAAELPAFNAWVDSIRFDTRRDGNNVRETVSWTTPETWKQEVPREGDPRLTVFQIGGKDSQLDCGVSTVSGSLLDNINRWGAQQLGRPVLGAGEMDRVLQYRTIDGRNVFLVDLTGPGGTGKAMVMPPHGKVQ